MDFLSTIQSSSFQWCGNDTTTKYSFFGYISNHKSKTVKTIMLFFLLFSIAGWDLRYWICLFALLNSHLFPFYPIVTTETLQKLTAPFWCGDIFPYLIKCTTRTI